MGEDLFDHLPLCNGPCTGKTGSALAACVSDQASCSACLTIKQVFALNNTCAGCGTE